MKRLALLLVLTVSLPLTAQISPTPAATPAPAAPASPADEAHHAKAQELMALLKAQTTVQQIADTILKQISSIGDQTVGAAPTDAQKAQLEAFKKQVNEMVEDQVGWKAMEAGIVDIYANTFSEDELDAIIAFYKTPAGSALVDKTGSINAQIGQLGNSRIVVLRPELTKVFDEFKKNMTAPAAPPAPAAPATPAAPASSTPK